MQMLQLRTKTIRLSNGQRIMELLRWSELEYATFIHETGLEYLELYIPNDRAGINALSRSKIFWSWWRNHWAIRDRDFIAAAENPDVYFFDYKEQYLFWHNPEILAGSIYPNAIVLGNSYAEMIDHFNKSVVV